MVEVTVLAFDPGETTGWCVMTTHTHALLRPDNDIGAPLHQVITFETGQIDCRMENRGVYTMVKLMEDCSNVVVVHEDFIIDFTQITKHRSALSPVRITAKFEYALWRNFKNNPPPFFIQNRSPVKTTCTDARLKNWGLYDRNSGPHARDAVRHAYYFLRDCRGDSLQAKENRFKAWPHIFEDPQARRPKKKPATSGERVTFSMDK